MKKITTLVSVAVLLMCTSCGSGDKNAEKKEAVDQGKIAAPQKLPTATPKKKPDDAVIKGVGKIDDASAAADVSIELSFNNDKHVNGTINVSNNKHTVEGVLDGDVLRCWIFSAVGDPKAVWRGTLIGKKIAAGFEGTFALSNNGAEKSVKGTWRSTK